jgi:hypothetical protein
MARPQKSGLDYFPLNVDIDIDDKISLIESEHGIVGFGIIIKMFCKIYGNSYFYQWGEKEQLLFSKRVNVDIKDVNACINSAIKWELFDEKTYKKYGVLTSIAIQKRYSEAISRRKAIDIIENYWLIDMPKLDKTTITVINVDTNEKNVYINSENADNNPQSKVKESKEKKSKEDIDKKDIDNLLKNKNVKSFPQNFPQVQLLINSGYITEDDEQLDEYNNLIDLLLLDYRVDIIDKVVSYFITNKPDIVKDRFAYFQTSLKNNLDKITGRKVNVNASESLNLFKQFLEA